MPPFLFPTGIAQICKDFCTKIGLRRKFVQEMRYFETKKKEGDPKVKWVALFAFYISPTFHPQTRSEK